MYNEGRCRRGQYDVPYLRNVIPELRDSIYIYTYTYIRMVPPLPSCDKPLDLPAVRRIH